MTEVPASFGKYYLTEKLAAGGMAEIYLGKLVGPGGFEKPLVIKQIHPRLSGQRHFVDLFVAEAKILVGLVHGNIVPVYELGVIGETYFIAMEYIDGPSLYRLTEQLRVHGAPMAPALAAHVATKILDGLDYAHRKGEGIIHRDLSGRNVMISRDGEVKLVDFGIAVTLGDAGDHSGDQPAGSFPYMSPEQVRREPLTGQSDLFSAGILLWEMLAGERLFAREDAEATLEAVAEAEIAPPSALNPAVPGRLDDVVMKALQRDRALRWQTASEMLAALHRYLYSLDSTPGPRELGQLVARHCPPTRRFRTESDTTAAAAAGDGTPPLALAMASTAVMPRPDRGVRQQSFATHVELAELLQPSEPGSSEPTTAVVVPSEEASANPSPSPSPMPTPSPSPSANPSPLPTPSPTPSPNPRPSSSSGATLPSRSRRMAIGAALVMAAAVMAAVVWRTGPPGPELADARQERAALGPAADGRATGPDAAPDAMFPEAPDAARGIDAATDAATAADAMRTTALVRSRDAGAHDARASLARDAAAKPAPDARPDGARPRRPDAAPVGVPAPTGEPAIIKVGANPWGEVVLDGKAVGRTPITLTMSAGHHEIEVSFPVGDPPRRETYRLDLTAGETRSVLADFTQ